MRAVDTNVLVRLFTRDDHQQAVLADKYIENGAWVPSVAVVEAMWVLGSVYQSDTNELIRYIEMLLQHERLILQEPDVVAAALALFRSRPSLGFTDCMI